MYQRTALIISRKLELPKQIEKGIYTQLTGSTIGIIGWIAFILRVIVTILFFIDYGFLVALISFFSSLIINSVFPIPYSFFKNQINKNIQKDKSISEEFKEMISSVLEK